MILPIELRKRFVDELNTFYKCNLDSCHEFELNQLMRLIDYIQQDTTIDNTLLHDFKNFYQQYDQRRGKNFKYTFTQLSSWYEAI